MLIAITANQTAGIGTVIGMAILVLWALGAAVYFTIQDIRDRPQRKAAAESNARVDAIRAATRAKNQEALRELFK